MRYIFVILLFIAGLPVKASLHPKREIRAAWLTTAYGLDWVSVKATTPLAAKKQREELCRMLDKLKEANFNTILFQVRIRGDVIYPSAIEPYNEMLTGKEGKEPGYDPLAFAIEECHKRGMELHAWIVSIPLGTAKHVRTQGKASVIKKEPSICKLYKGEWYLDPGNPRTKDYLSNLVREIVNKYDVDGIHLDYIRYPDHPATFPDKDSYRKYGKGLSLAAWRRENITAIVRSVYKTVKSMKPWVKVSSSPIGKFRDTSRYSSKGWNAYYTVYQDAQGWLKEGIQDILFPMMYFSGNQFYPFALDWQEQSNGRYIVPGLGIYFLHPSEKNWALDEIERQINFTRKEGLAGQAYYRAKYVADNTKGLLDEMACKYYAYPALSPVLTWIDSIPPAAPSSPELKETSGETLLTWNSSTDNDGKAVPYYVIYASNTYPVDIRDANTIVATRIRDSFYLDSYIYPDRRKKYYAVTAIDAFGNESRPLQFNNRMETGVPHCNGIVLYLPPLPEAEYVTITDLAGRCISHCPYSQDILFREKLEPGSYRILVTNEKDKIKCYTLLVVP